MPKTMDRFDHRGDDMLDKGTSLLDGKTLVHVFIVTKAGCAGVTDVPRGAESADTSVESACERA